MIMFHSKVVMRLLQHLAKIHFYSAYSLGVRMGNFKMGAFFIVPAGLSSKCFWERCQFPDKLLLHTDPIWLQSCWCLRCEPGVILTAEQSRGLTRSPHPVIPVYCLQEATMESKLAVNEGCALELPWKTTHDSFRIMKNLIVNVLNVEKQNI